MKKVCVFHGSPHKNGNTHALTEVVLDELRRTGCSCHEVWVYDQDIKPCIGCGTCQNNLSAFGCPQQDNVAELFALAQQSDIILLATPIYVWYCTAPLKALSDRLIYGAGKYYGVQKGGSLLEGKELALVTTCGYTPEKGAAQWEEGMRRACLHANMIYHGQLCERDLGREVPFMNEETIRHAREFALTLLR